MRLAFSVAINVDADILLIDEILAVGDASFQAKCFNRLKKLKADGTTIVIVSHALGQIEQFCDRAIWIDKGEIRIDATPREVVPLYVEWMGEKRGIESSPTKLLNDGSSRVGNRDIEVINVKMLHNNAETYRLKTGNSIQIQINYKVNKPVSNPVFGIGIFRVDGVHCYGTNTRIDSIEVLDIGLEGKVTLTIHDLNLLPSEYSLDVAIHTEADFYFDGIYKAKTFRTYSSVSDVGVSRLNHTWKFERGD